MLLRPLPPLLKGIRPLKSPLGFIVAPLLPKSNGWLASMLTFNPLSRFWILLIPSEALLWLFLPTLMVILLCYQKYQWLKSINCEGG